MVAYSFKKRFAEPILAGTKAQTIRADRKRHARPGEELQLYTGMRTKQCKLIGRATCLDVQSVWLSLAKGWIMLGHTGYIFGTADLDAFARSDGFADWAGMKAFWLDVHQVVDEFFGVLIRWRPIGAALYQHGQLERPSTSKDLD